LAVFPFFARAALGLCWSIDRVLRVLYNTYYSNSHTSSTNGDDFISLFCLKFRLARAKSLGFMGGLASPGPPGGQTSLPADPSASQCVEGRGVVLLEWAYCSVCSERTCDPLHVHVLINQCSSYSSCGIDLLTLGILASVSEVGQLLVEDLQLF